MELHQLRYFRAVAQCGSFTLAARREHVSQPTLSHQVLKLEDNLGGKLFKRTGKSVKLTQLGEMLLPTAESILGQLAAAQAQIRETVGTTGGRVQLGVIPTIAPFLLPDILSAFSKQHPLIEVKVIEETGAVLLHLLREGHLDFCIMPSVSSTKGLLCTELLRERLYAAVCDTHLLAAHKSVTLAQLTGNPFLSLKDGHCFRTNVSAMFERARLEPRITFESGCFLTILNMVKAGMGISVVPEMAVNHQAGCRFIPIQDQQPVRVISLVQMRNGRPTRAQKLLMEFIRESASLIQRGV